MTVPSVDPARGTLVGSRTSLFRPGRLSRVSRVRASTSARFASNIGFSNSPSYSSMNFWQPLTIFGGMNLKRCATDNTQQGEACRAGSAAGLAGLAGLLRLRTGSVCHGQLLGAYLHALGPVKRRRSGRHSGSGDRLAGQLGHSADSRACARGGRLTRRQSPADQTARSPCSLPCPAAAYQVVKARVRAR